METQEDTSREIPTRHFNTLTNPEMEDTEVFLLEIPFSLSPYYSETWSINQKGEVCIKRVLCSPTRPRKSQIVRVHSLKKPDPSTTT